MRSNYSEVITRRKTSILKQKWYYLTLKVQARNESVRVSIHDLPAVIASLGVGTCPKRQSRACPDRSVRACPDRNVRAYADHACQSTLYGAGSVRRAWVRPQPLRRPYSYPWSSPVLGQNTESRANGGERHSVCTHQKKPPPNGSGLCLIHLWRSE